MTYSELHKYLADNILTPPYGYPLSGYKLVMPDGLEITKAVINHEDRTITLSDRNEQEYDGETYTRTCD